MGLREKFDIAEEKMSEVTEIETTPNKTLIEKKNKKN